MLQCSWQLPAVSEITRMLRFWVGISGIVRYVWCFLGPPQIQARLVELQVIVVAMQVRPVEIRVNVVELHLSSVEIHVEIVELKNK